MKNLNKICIYLLFIGSVTGCITPIPFKGGGTGINNPDAGRISITSFNRPYIGNMFKGGVAPGSIWIDGNYLGDFTDQNPVFSQELAPGVHTVEVCQTTLLYGKRDRCGMIKLNMQPKTHLFYEYHETSNSRSLFTVRQEPYNTAAQAPAASSVVSPNPTSQPSVGSANLDDAKKKCIELGFKLGTESFGNCVLRVAK